MSPITRGYSPATVEQLQASDFMLQRPTTSLPSRLLLASIEGGAVEEVVQVFSPQAVAADATVADVIDDGGVFLIQHPANGDDAASVKQEVGDRAYIVSVGPYDAALVWADPFFEGDKRSYNIYWSDGTYDFSVIAGLDTPEESLTFAMSLYC
jgi:hypothetical protein